ncbi:DUF952 domain-containing protein [Mycoplasmatota bacterium WC44]
MKDIIITLNKKAAQEFIDLGIHKLEGSFIHACTTEQLEYVLNKHYENKDVYLFYLDQNIDNLKWEEAMNGDLFPHIYGDIDKSDVVKVQFLENE